ncbi:GTPase Era [Ahniella affigens]|uniref:GTPase Era n=1 Tax=Ahniella affigens TaxID=2021234 RepID=A0A2P1PSI3_9GAMM|nr:GTPase Era [Ahniella affigens]AVP97801.1 GTPase Era [Ahniella affigens]
MNDTQRFARVAVLGRPNVGKSTLLNRLVGTKLSITAAKPQTTRHQILGVLTEGPTQLALIDTPGIHQGGNRALNRSLNRAARAALEEADVLLWVIDATRFTEEDELVASLVKSAGKPLVIVLNKIDRIADKTRLLPRLQQLTEQYQAEAIVPFSAMKERSASRVFQAVAKLAKPGEHAFAEDDLTDRSERFLAAERVREQVVRQLRDELPFATSVEIESFQREGNLLRLAAVIWVEREGQKAIVIGRSGEQLKQIGSHARQVLEKFFDCKVHLETWVRVRENWSDDERALRALGVDEG